MITRPTTDTLILDCCRELTDAILPALTDETLRLRLVMTETVLRNAAVRAAHETAWMLAETSDLMAYATQVAAGHESEPLRAAIAAAEAGPPDSLHLADVADRYERAGQAFARRWRWRRKPGPPISSRRRGSCYAPGSRPRSR